jgi:serine/threonine-protein kinase
VLGESYQIDRLIGGGAMGKVYEATHVRLPRRFAIKILNPEFAQRTELLDRFRREAEIASSLGHDNIVQVFDFNRTTDGLSYMVMELLEGQDLRHLLDEQQRLTLDKTVEIISDVASALGSAHARGIVHRDLKPENVFLCKKRNTRAEIVKVLDFGVSKVLDCQTLATTANSLVGTPHYMAPEQAVGSSPDVDQRADVFALGALAYECLTGELAFEGPNAIGVLYSVVHHEPRPIQELRPEVPEAMAKVISRALSKERDQRQPNAATFRREFLAAYGVLEPESSEGEEPAVALPSIPGARYVSGPRWGSDDAVGAVSAQTMLSTPEPRSELGTMPTLAQASLSRAPAAETKISRTRTIVLIALALGAIGGVAALISIRTEASRVAPASVSNRPTALPAPSAGEPAQSRTPTPESACIASIDLDIVPKDAQVELNGVVTSQNPLRLPCSDRALHLVVSAPGFVTQSREIVALMSGKVVMVLVDRHGAPLPHPARATSKAAPDRSASPSKPATSLGPMERSL